MTYTNWNLVQETNLPNGSRGAVARCDIDAGRLLGVFQGDLARIEIRDERLAEPEKHINLTIAAGEALTADYRLWDLVPEGIPCWCDEPKCII